MIRRVVAIALLYLKTTFSSRTVLIFSIVMPLLFTFVLGVGMEAMAGGESPQSWSLLVVDEDRSQVSRMLIGRLEDEPLVEPQAWEREAALAAVEDGEAIAALVIPAGFGAALQAGEEAGLRFYASADEISRAQILEQAVQAASAELGGSFAAADFSARLASRMGLLEGAAADVREAYAQAAFGEMEKEWEAGAPLKVVVQPVTRKQESTIPIGARQSSPGMLVMYALFFTFGGGSSLIAERDTGTLRRLLVMPMGKGTVLLGKLVGIFVGAIVQMSIMVLAGQFLFGVDWGQAPAALAVMLLAYGFAGTALGLLVAALARTVAQANALGTIAILALASLGGAWWPIEIVPRWMQQLALALPTGWAMRGFHDILTRGLGLPEVLLEAGVLVGFGLLFLLLGVWRFRYE